MFCHKCGNKVPEGASFCQKCGERLIKDEAVPDAQTVNTNPVSPSAKKINIKILFVLTGIVAIVIATIAIILSPGRSVEYPNELLYEGLPVARFLEMTKDDFIAEFGEPDQNYPEYPGISYDEKGITLINFSEETGKLICMNFYSERCTFNGKKFVDIKTEKAIKNFATPEGTLGTPSNNIDYSFYSKINRVSDSKFKFFRVIENTYTLEFITYEDFMIYIFLYSNELDEPDQYLNGDSGSYENNLDKTYFVELSNSYSEGYEPAIILYQDGRFSFLANMGEGVGFYNGTYHVNGDVYEFNITETEFYGNKTNFEFEFVMRLDGDALIYESEDSLGLTLKGAIFSLCDTMPKSIINARNYEGTYEGEDELYVPTQEVGFQRSEYFNLVTHIDFTLS